MENLFKIRDYRHYLKEVFSKRKSKNRKKAAVFMNCHPTHVSQVLGGRSHLSLEQAILFSEYLGHSGDETHFFVLLVQYSRAGNTSLRQHYLMQLEKILRERSQISSHLNQTEKVPEKASLEFYSRWHLGVIHVLTSIPKFQTVEAITNHVKMHRSEVVKALDFLTSLGLVTQPIEGKFQMGKAHVHLPNNHPMVSKHHVNWRVKAISSLDNPHDDDLHYSGSISLSLSDANDIRRKVVDLVKETISQVDKSKPEIVRTFCIDFFDPFH